MRVTSIIYIMSFISISCNDSNNNFVSYQEKHWDNMKVEFKMDTSFREYYEDGKSRTVRYKINDTGQSFYVQFHKNNTIAETGMMLKNVKNGVWKNYDNNGILVTANLYHNGDILFELDKTDFYLLPTKLLPDSFEIDMPFKWQTINDSSLHIILGSRKQCDKSFIFCPNITIVKDRINKDAVFDEYLTSQIDLLKGKYPGLHPVASGHIDINGFPSFQLTYIFQTNGLRLGGISTWIKANESVYIITGMASNQKNSEFLKYKDLFREIAGTFRHY